MMSELKKLREQRASLIKQQRDLFDNAKKENRNLSTEEHEQFNRMEADVADTRREIQALEALERNLGEINEQRMRETEGQPGASQPDYNAVFSRAMRFGMNSLNEEERSLMASQRTVGTISRGTDPQQSGSDTLGGYTVPEGFSDELFTEMAAWGGMLEACRIVRSSSGNPLPWPTTDDTATKGAILAETAQDTTSDVTFGQKMLGAYTYTSRIIKASIEFVQDSAFSVNEWIPPVAARRIGTAANEHFTTGTGTGQPNGVVGAAGAGVTAASATAITRNELVDLVHSVNKAYRRNARFMFNDSTLAAIKKLSFGSGDDRPLWQAGNIANGEPSTLEGYQYTINYDMDDIATGNVSLLFGDFSKYIIRQVGQPTLLRLNERYADYLHVAWIMYQRLDGELLSANAVKKLTQA